jgi:hypothetical protein
MEQQLRLMQERAIQAENQMQQSGLNKTKQMEDFDTRLTIVILHIIWQ